MINKLKNEPSVVVSALVAVVGAAATLGLIGTDQQAQIVAVITALVPIVGGLILRANVTPNRKVGTSVGTMTVKLKPQFVSADDAPADVPAPVTPDVTDATPAEPAPAPAPEDPVKASMKAAIENVRAQSNQRNDARAAAASAAVDASA